MSILRATENSVLWLLQDNVHARENLMKEAKTCGVDPARLVFASRMPLADHLARHRAADLFLDSYPYTAHTTTSDALWAGLPVLTRIGQTFASRVAASLLRAAGLSELVTSTADEFVAAAIALASQAEPLSGYRQRLARNRENCALFDTSAYARNLETAYEMMVERYRQGLRPDHLFIGDKVQQQS